MKVLIGYSNHKGCKVSWVVARYNDYTMIDGTKDRMMTGGEKRGPPGRTGMAGHQ